MQKPVTLFYENTQDLPRRIDQFLGVKFPQYSRSYFQRLIAEGWVAVNGIRVDKPSLVMREGDEVTVTFPPERPLDLTPKRIDFDLIAQESDFVVVNKPAGLMVHPTSESKETVSLVQGLLYQFKELEAFEEKDRPGIVHRLDKNTSGLLIVARHIRAQIKLSQMFKQRLVHKKYLAVVKGHPSREGSISYPIGRHPIERHKMSHQGYNPREALTHYRVLVYYKDSSLLEVSPVTGRTHQIRVHLAAIGHGIIGDTIYGQHSKLIDRQALHAWKLSFDYEGKHYSYHCPIPADFCELVKALTKTMPKKKLE